MKIGPLDTKPTAVPVAERKTGTTAGAAEEPSSRVELSSAAQLVDAGGDGSFDAEKVKRIAQTIRDGTYEINAEAIADKLIANAHEVLDKTNR